MKEYIVTVEFTVKDDGSIEKEIEKNGLDDCERNFAIGFSDPNFHNVICTINENR